MRAAVPSDAHDWVKSLHAAEAPRRKYEPTAQEREECGG